MSGGSYPNSYTFSKALSEYIFLEYCMDLPAAIVRPGIVQASWKEPFSGWVELSGGGINVLICCFMGLLKSLRLHRKLPSEVVPVDVVANTLITAAWYTASYRSNRMEVYNCTSAQINRIILQTYLDLIVKYSKEYPSRSIVFYPGLKYRTSLIMQNISNLFFNYVPALILDVYSHCTNRKLKTSNILRQIVKSARETEFGVMILRQYRSKNFENLIKAAETAEDGETFSMDMIEKKGFYWENYSKNLVLGMRKHILGEDISTVDLAKKKLFRLFWIIKAFQYFLIVVSLGSIISYKEVYFKYLKF